MINFGALPVFVTYYLGIGALIWFIDLLKHRLTGWAGLLWSIEVFLFWPYYLYRKATWGFFHHEENDFLHPNNWYPEYRFGHPKNLWTTDGILRRGGTYKPTEGITFDLWMKFQGWPRYSWILDPHSSTEYCEKDALRDIEMLAILYKNDDLVGNYISEEYWNQLGSAKKGEKRIVKLARELERGEADFEEPEWCRDEEEYRRAIESG